MTKREFRNDIERGPGGCVLALRDKAARERFRPLVLWACGRESVVKEIGRRHMLTPELLAEMQYDCNDEIRAYAARCLRAAERKTKRGNAPNERRPDESKPYE